MGQYSKKGLYSGYKKNNKEREELDYYSTPTKEVENILETLGISFEEKTILEPCVGGGHMLQGIINYCNKYNQKPFKIIATDVKDRNPSIQNNNQRIHFSLGEQYDFLLDDYPIDSADIIIMNPPFSTIEPFVIRALEIAPVVIMLGRTQFVEAASRYENIFKEHPMTKIYQYVDRIQCYKNGDESIKGSSAQAYAWFIWDNDIKKNATEFDWIKRK